MPAPPLRRSVQRALVRHALLTAVVAAVLGGLLVVGVWRVAEAEGHATARLVSEQAAGGLTASLAEIDFRSPQATRHDVLLADLAPFLEAGIIHRVKVWIVDGDRSTVVFSDEPRIEGESGVLDPDLARRVDAGEMVSLRLPDDDEHRYEIAAGMPLIEVFTGFTDAAGNQMRLEIYVPFDVAATTRGTAAVLLPMTLAGLLALGIATVPLSVSLARRMERDRDEHRAALRYGLAASDRERGELAQQLHDGVIQDLAGAGMLLQAIRSAGGSRTVLDGRPGLLEEAQRLVEQDVRELRDLASSLLPSTFGAADLRAALTDLVAQLRGGGDTAVAVEVESTGLGDDTAALLHRISRELLRNAFRHSGASRIDVRVVPTGRGLVLTVSDDGVGFDPGSAPEGGHIGLRLVRRALEEAGGELTVTSAAGAGTTVTATFPAGAVLDRSPQL
ncbi:sensor histidine kinase [Pseudonocardia hydrocarbonoxydans]|uniref:Oxygen sensor histidine kinase NreB n=1 Tax=Pseudonocardia hydrocarbonoxydans TaxID=76726 RepID=A0A4Y3WN59_9PSEU|nr:ATP-binding protein [Pseudonocardia hydrocarbonoxydans]GEC19918.1 hypothetical protein PHY01_22010 [Pseudonocardia hydrocarbonoxydans]